MLYELAALCTRNDSKCTANPSRIEGNIGIRETFKVWEVGRTFLALSQGCTEEVPLYASMHSGDAAICVRSLLAVASLDLDVHTHVSRGTHVSEAALCERL